ncbi:MAG TPA: hypothetical protein VJ570_08075 [Holophagaceae bacterium]|nr:hypothetical protein [Holophagaceae bacterium]
MNLRPLGTKAAQTAARARLLAPFLAGGLAFTALSLAAWHYYAKTAGIGGLLSAAAQTTVIRTFLAHYFGEVILPVYLATGLLAWFITLGWGGLFHRPWFKAWRSREGFFFTLSALAWVHFVYWWQTPTTLWVIPGLRALPVWVDFLLLAGLLLFYPILWIRRHLTGALRRTACLGGWLAAWTLLALLPQAIGRIPNPTNGGDATCEVLWIGLDGLRSDTFLQDTKAWKGQPYQHAYTPIPATRLLWNILWGGDPARYTVGHVTPADVEFERDQAPAILKMASEQGWKPRFYIDDGGTIGIAGRSMGLDDALMPARGWENFINSNLAASFPLYANWENRLKPFPTTNPWSPFADGIKEALRLGRGSKWVMFHSCLAHEPIFLRRAELANFKGWWRMRPFQLEPFEAIQQLTSRDVMHPKERMNPFEAYQVRMASILEAWQPVWNALDKDPAYAKATRVLFSDHGERFYHVTPDIQLQGTHGFNLDPWEVRVAFLVSGGAFPDQAGLPPSPKTVSLLGLRDGVRRMLEGKGPLDPQTLESLYPKAPMRYHTLSRKQFTFAEPGDYRDISTSELASQVRILPDGLWFTHYATTAEERANYVSVGLAEGGNLSVFKPLTKGGAHLWSFKDFDLTHNTVTPLDEADFQKAKAEVDGILGIWKH